VGGKDDYLINVMIDMGLLSNEQVSKYGAEAEAAGLGLIEYLLSKNVIRPSDVTYARASYFGAEVVNLSELKITDDVIAAVPRHVAKRYKVFPVYKHDNTIGIALSDPSDLSTLDALRYFLNHEIEPKVASEEDIEAALNKYYGASEDDVSKIIQNITEGDVMVAPENKNVTDDDGSSVESDAPIIRLVNSLIVEAFKSRASDIHLEPLSKTFRVRYRIDGVLHEVKSPPKKLQLAIISRLKIMSNMSIAEKRIPQDGRIQTQVAGKMIDLRVSCIPTAHGESIVMRILDKEGLKLGLGELGFFTDDQQVFERLISLPDGILLVTGPTGSGKTTTLYSCLNYINRPDRKIITVEDPVEYTLSGINQVHVNETVGLTFAAALRSILRQAPNIIMIVKFATLKPRQ
jgi:general secretion pathway protein E/type IV pilus assembly protein PilB